MNPVDLLVICWLLWGGAIGYISGARRMGNRIAILMATIFVSNGFKPEIRRILGHSYPVAGYIREVVGQRLALPVAAPAGDTGSSLPLFLKQLYLGYPSLSVGGGSWLDPLCQALLNVLCFCLAFLVWGSGCYVVSAAWVKKGAGGITRREQWVGVMIGVAGAVLLAALVIGVGVPLLTLLPFGALRLEQSALFQYVWVIAIRLQIW